jgi:1-acyl-sn-glycerol-3-phosphate acyltransferase
MGSGPSSFDRPWKEWLLRRTGGLLPVWRGGTDVSIHVRSAQAVLDEHGVLALFAEGRIAGPPDVPSRLRTGAALLALRTGAPIVPVAICGAEELYRGKRTIVHILEPTSAAELLGPRWQESAVPGSRGELRAARAISEAIALRLGDAIAADHPGTLDPPGTAYPWRWLTRLMR